MKKKKLLFILIPSVVLLLLLILFLPIPVGTLEDGKSLDFQALTYRLIRWDRTLTYIDGSTEPYVKWSIYAPSYRNSPILDLWTKARENESNESYFTATILEIRENEMLVEEEGTTPYYHEKFLCKLQENTKFSDGSEPIPRANLGVGDMVYVAYLGDILETYPAQIPNVTRVVQISTPIPYNASYIHVDGSGEHEALFFSFAENAPNDNRPLPIAEIESQEELKQILSSLKATESYTEGVLWKNSALFDLCDTYGEEFFQNKSLLLIYTYESSSSNAHRIRRCYLKDGVCTVEVEALIPQSGDCAMAGWVVCLEVEKSEIAESSFDAYRVSQQF